MQKLCIIMGFCLEVGASKKARQIELTLLGEELKEFFDKTPDNIKTMFKRYVLFFQARRLKKPRETEVHKTEEKRSQSAGAV